VWAAVAAVFLIHPARRCALSQRVVGIDFIKAEFHRIKRQVISRERLVDTLLLARRKHPGVSNRLDDLCSRYSIGNSRRTKHGVLLDAGLRAALYIDPIGARQSRLILASRRPRSASGLRRHVGRQAGLERFSGSGLAPPPVESVHMEAALGITSSVARTAYTADDRLGGIVAGECADADHVSCYRGEEKETTVHVIKLVVGEGVEVHILRFCDWHVHFYSPVFQPAHHERAGGGSLLTSRLREVM
jgi:hypothetical protein